MTIAISRETLSNEEMAAAIDLTAAQFQGELERDDFALGNPVHIEPR